MIGSIATQATWPLLLVPLALALAFLGYRRTTPPVAGMTRAVLVGLRTVAYALLLIVLASPVWNRARNIETRARIAFLVDESASMGAADGAAGLPTRFARARAAVATLRAALDDAPVDIEIVPFGDEPQAAADPAAYLAAAREPTSPGTDPLTAVRTTVERASAGNLRALVLFSDGRPTRGGLDPGAAASLGVPVFTVGFGDTVGARDLSLGRVEYPPVTYVESEAVIDVQLDHAGFRGQRATARLMHDGREIWKQGVTFDAERGRIALRAPIELRTPGRQRLRLELETLPGEFTTRNNTRELSIEVLPNRIRVLLVAARPDWDTAHFARALAADPSLRVTSVHQDARGAWVDANGRAFTLPDAARLAQDVDCIVLASIGASGGGFAREVARAVERGKALLLLGGRESVLAQAAAMEALSGVLPIGRARRAALAYGNASVRLAPQGRVHAATSGLVELAEDSGALPVLAPLLGLYAGLEPVPSARLLLETETQVPVLVVGRAGEGQSAVLNGFPLWRWSFTERDAVAAAARGVFTGLVRALVQPRDVRPVQIALPKSVFESGEGVSVRAHVLDPRFEPLDDAEVRLDVRRVDGDGATAGTRLLERRIGHPGEYAGSLPGLGPGEYEAAIEARRNGATIGRDTARFTVDPYSVEFANPSQDVEFLRGLAAVSGGRAVGAEDAASLAGLLPREPSVRVQRSEIDLWNTTPLFILFVVALGAEWLLRKRLGML